ncbi:uncharacterized protein FFB20_00041 [Fusarium fujikuroi]|nr:uncharacterized protein FFB20_00041 [Fusarium fujikuroi]SCN76675.1 uncharacterized protein FFC1_02383 [Fusarium fujikuroi]SCN87243.1 uncharacterized protein FFE2_06321 [Fusarium fujikuroi]SCN93667.1 uncharacterized protein FFM5_05771 [Fusarium fujikuroi]SCO31155.1 uncharacterized protein FFNC_01847 [Fusarium fujikuroi]
MAPDPVEDPRVRRTINPYPMMVRRP